MVATACPQAVFRLARAGPTRGPSSGYNQQLLQYTMAPGTMNRGTRKHHRAELIESEKNGCRHLVTSKMPSAHGCLLPP